jgi:hypothetical protein
LRVPPVWPGVSFVVLDTAVASASFRGGLADPLRARLTGRTWCRIMLRLPRTLLDPETAGRYCAGRQVSVSTTREHVILDLTGGDEAGEWVEGAEDSLSAIVGVRSELAAGDLRPLYLTRLLRLAAGWWSRGSCRF